MRSNRNGENEKKKKKSMGSPARRLTFAAGLFALICGLAIVLFGGRSPVGPHDGPPRDERIRERALQHAEAAERALMDRDYGEARAHVRRLRTTLARQESGRRVAAE